MGGGFRPTMVGQWEDTGATGTVAWQLLPRTVVVMVTANGTSRALQTVSQQPRQPSWQGTYAGQPPLVSCLQDCPHVSGELLPSDERCTKCLCL